MIAPVCDDAVVGPCTAFWPLWKNLLLLGGVTAVVALGWGWQAIRRARQAEARQARLRGHPVQEGYWLHDLGWLLVIGAIVAAIVHALLTPARPPL